MIEKQDVLEYLRNQQKLTEASAKSTGMTLWVMIAAAGIISMRSLGDLTLLTSHEQEATRALMIAEALFLFFVFDSHLGAERDELRNLSWSGITYLPRLSPILESLALLAPPLLSLWFIGVGVSNIYLAINALISLAISLFLLSSRIRSRPKARQRLPSPYFRPPARASEIAGLGLTAGFLFVIFSQTYFLWVNFRGPIALVQALALEMALLMLIMGIFRKWYSSSINKWPFDLETNVFVGVTKPDAALREIEIHAIGESAEHVLNEYFREIDEKFSRARAVVSSIREKARLGIGHCEDQERGETVDGKENVEIGLTLMDSIQDDLHDLLIYLKRLQNSRHADSRTLPLMHSLLDRLEQYSQQARNIHDNLKKQILSPAGEPLPVLPRCISSDRSTPEPAGGR